ncbi:MAG TPA: peptide ABC transporter substrate-binding protein [Roseiflexaceae bacterium]|nr:peptide ABC transporter substrate-binding protein [Roseiflexaceae bacterium]
MSRNRTWSIAILLLVFSVILAACGGAPATAPTAAPAAPAAEPTRSVADVPTAVPISQPTAVPAATAAPAPTTAAEPGAAGGTLNGVTLPADAAPADQQVFVVHYDNTADFTTIDFFESVYKRGGAVADILSDALVRIDKNFQINPGAATKWEVDSTGLVWTFTLDPNLIWTDDTPVTADDYVATFRYAADPKHAWDFTWFFGGVIKNWDDVVAGKMPVDQLGVKAADAHTLQFETQSPAPYLPAMLLYSMPLQKKALEAHGGLYNSDVATTVSSGPYVLKEWQKGERLVYEANPKYKGTNKPFIQKIVVIGAAPSTGFAAYQAGEIDFVAGPNLSPADNDIVSADPQLSKEFHPHYGDFRTDYLFFDTKNPPFDNVKVRQAFSHVIDRDGLIQSIIKPTQGIPAYSFLMPGFPASNSKALSTIQNYDVEAAKKLLAEAGYPDGKGFPKLTLWLRNEAPVRQAMAQAIAASIKQNLGVDVEVSNKETKTFTDAMNAKPTEIQFGMVSYGFDFLDPYNMLSVWLSGGRHNWNNTQFDDMVKKAASFTGDPAERIKMFQDAEKLLVEDVGGIFIYHRTAGDLYKPYLKGSELDPDNNGFAAMHWPGFGANNKLVGTMYISKDVASSNRQIP